MAKEQIDRLGAMASGLCAVHCAICALLPAAFGALGLGVLMDHSAEWVFTGVSIAFALCALAVGCRRHRSVLVAALLTLGIAGLLTSRFLEDGHGHSEHAHTAESGEQGLGGTHEDEHGSHSRELHDPHGRESHVDESHRGGLHTAGTGVGVLAGLLVLAGHIFNIRATRREDCCD